jgi:hypothetical protein
MVSDLCGETYLKYSMEAIFSFFEFGFLSLSLYGGLAWRLRLFVNDWRALGQRSEDLGSFTSPTESGTATALQGESGPEEIFVVAYGFTRLMVRPHADLRHCQLCWWWWWEARKLLMN